MTDSGGFQMVSLLKLAQITEEGVKFTSPYDNSEMNMTPEHSMEIQVCMRNTCTINYFKRVFESFGSKFKLSL